MHVDIAPKKVAYNPGSRQPAAKTHRPREWRGFQRGVNSPLNVIELSNPKCLIRRAPPYRGVSEAVSSMSVLDRPTLLALSSFARASTFRSGARLLNYKMAGRERLRVTGAALG